MSIWQRRVEFFRSDGGYMSMSRLLTFLSFFPASAALIMNPTEGMMLAYVGAYAVVYVGGKLANGGKQEVKCADAAAK